MLWMLGRAESASLHVVGGRQKVSNLPIVFIKHVLDAHISRFLRDDSFENQRQMLKWMDLRIFPILRSLFDLSRV